MRSNMFFNVLQYFATKLGNFTNFNMLFLAVVKDFDFFAKMKIRISLKGEWSIAREEIAFLLCVAFEKCTILSNALAKGFRVFLPKLYVYSITKNFFYYMSL